MTAIPTIPQARKFADITLRAPVSVAVSKSPFTGQRQVYKYDADNWVAVINLVAMARPDYEIWNAFFLELDGPVGKFLMGDPLGATPRGSAAIAPGLPLVRGAGQTGTSLVVDGLPPNAVGYLKKGDYFQHGTDDASRLYKLTGDVNADAGGIATLTFRPRLRVVPADNDPIVVANAVGVWSLADSFTEFKIGKGGKSAPKTVNLEEPL